MKSATPKRWAPTRVLSSRGFFATAILRLPMNPCASWSYKFSVLMASCLPRKVAKMRPVSIACFLLLLLLASWRSSAAANWRTENPEQCGMRARGHGCEAEHRRTCAYRKPINPNVTLLHYVENLPAYQFARDRVSDKVHASQDIRANISSGIFFKAPSASFRVIVAWNPAGAKNIKPGAAVRPIGGAGRRSY